MIQSPNYYTKDDCSKKEKISYELFLDSSLLLLGFNYSSIGKIFYKEMLRIVYKNNNECIKLNKLFKQLSKQYNVTTRNIQNNIQSSFRRMNTNMAEQNFRKVFGIEYSNFFITPKNLIVLFLNTLNRLYY